MLLKITILFEIFAFNISTPCIFAYVIYLNVVTSLIYIQMAEDKVFRWQIGVNNKQKLQGSHHKFELKIVSK
jgi:hypothetical protein